VTITTEVPNLKSLIAEFMEKMGAHAPPEVLQTLGAELGALAASGIARGALQVGVRAPRFSLPEARGGVVTLDAELAKGPVIVTFYRGGWCPFCDLQLRAYQSILSEIHGLGAQLIAISPQTPDYALSDTEKKALTFPVLSDVHHVVARQYGLVLKLSPALQALQVQFGNPMPKFNGDDSWELPMPGTFVLDNNGVVQLAHVDTDYTRRLEPSALLDALRAVRGQ
jgi:peroxiredoxin